MISAVQGALIAQNKTGTVSTFLVKYHQVLETLNIDRDVSLAVVVMNGANGKFPDKPEGIAEVISDLVSANKVYRSDVLNLYRSFIDYRSDAEKSEAKKRKDEYDAKKSK